MNQIRSTDSSRRWQNKMTSCQTVGLRHLESFTFSQLKVPSALDPVIDFQNQMRLASFKNSCFCQKVKEKDVFFMCKCTNMAHKTCMPWRVHDFGEFECTACTILNNDPLNEVIEVLLEPSILHSSFTYKFKLKLQEFNALNTDENLDIEIRCIKMDGEHFFEQTWPDRADIRVNGVLVKQVTPLLHNSSLKKRRDEKLIIMKPIIGTNTISFNFANVKDGKNTKADRDPMYTFAVVLIRKLSVNELADKIVHNNTVGKADCMKLIKDKFLGSRDVKISEVKADLDCKISFTPMVHPARGKYCTHMNCFSLKLFIKSMQSNAWRNWSCPLCRKPCYKLVVDSYMETIIADIKRIDPTRSEVFFKKDGSVCLNPEGDLQAELLSTGGSSKLGYKHSTSKALERHAESSVVVVDDEDTKSEISLVPRPLGNMSLTSDLPAIDEKSTVNLSDDQLLGKRQVSVEKSFLDDKEFLGYLHNYIQRSPQSRSEPADNFKSRPGFSSFEYSLQKRINSDVITRQMFQVFYSIIMKKKRETELLREKSPIKGLYQDLLTDINAVESTEKSMTSSHQQQLDVLQWVLRDYRLDYQHLPYLLDKNQIDDERDSFQFF